MSTTLIDKPVVTALQLRQAVLDAQQTETRAAAVKLHAVAAYAKQRFNMYYAGDKGPDGVDIDKSANAELAAFLVDSNPRITQWLFESTHQYRIPAIGIAFDDGTITLSKLTIVRLHTEHASKESLSRCADEIVACAHRLAPKPLGVEIERILAQDDPEFKGRAHRASIPSRKVRATSAAHGMGRVTTTGTAEEAAEIAASVTALMDGLCPGDPRTVDEKSVDAHLALVRRLPFLCLCTQCIADRAAAAAAAAAADSDLPVEPPVETGPRAVVHIHADAETLLGLADNPAFIEGFGYIDPDTARRISADATWQAFIRIANGGLDPDGNPGGPDGTPDPEREERARRATHNRHAQRRGPSTAWGRTDARWTDRAVHDASMRRTGTKIIRTPRFPAGFIPPRSPASATPGAGARIDAWLKFIAEYPDDVYAQYPDGHGGYQAPPPGALVYRPSEILKAAVRLRDQTCRHPGCSVPAGSCEIDHIVPFDHSDPLSGGWTIESDLQALCKHHHGLKTAKLWLHEMLPGALMHTVDPLGTHHISLPGTR